MAGAKRDRTINRKQNDGARDQTRALEQKLLTSLFVILLDELFLLYATADDAALSGGHAGDRHIERGYRIIQLYDRVSVCASVFGLHG
jgi:hypothetical protein